jgi:RsiW-degrading membrane proteinase PrsW (M82 family)
MTLPDPRFPNLTSRPASLKRSPQVSAIKIALAFLAILIAVMLGLIVLLVIGIETGPIGLIFGFIAATIPVPLYVVLVLWIDRYEGEPLWMLLTAFFWGALIASFFAFLLNTSSGMIVTAIASDAVAGEAFAAVVSAPIVEEIGKALILIIFFLGQKDEFDGVVDGIVYASMVGLGFAMTENILYYGNAASESGGMLTATVIVRGFFAPFSHPLFTSLTGIGLGLARQSTDVMIKILAPIIGLLMAIVMHSIWNGSAVFGGGPIFFMTYVVVMVPAFLIMLIVIVLALRREGQVVRQFLVTDIERGLFTREEYEQLGSISGRMGSSFSALSRSGMKGWRTRRRINQLASELAFHRSRISRGIRARNQDPEAQEAAYLHALHDLINELRGRVQ